MRTGEKVQEVQDKMKNQGLLVCTKVNQIQPVSPGGPYVIVRTNSLASCRDWSATHIRRQKPAARNSPGRD